METRGKDGRGQVWTMAAGLGLLLGALPGLARAADHTVSEVEVVGRAPAFGAERSGISKLSGALIDTPQSITAISREELDQRGVTAIDDALRTVPGISLGAGEYSFQGSNVFIRGFTSRNDMFLDGMRDYGYYFRDTFNAETVEVLKGSASILFGRGSTGGVINQTSKQPSLRASLAASAAWGSNDLARATLDANMPLPSLGEGAALRVNLMGHRSEVAGRDGGESRRWGIAPTLALGLGTPTRFTAAYFHQSEDNRPDYGQPWFNGVPAKVDRRNFYGFPQDYFDSDVDILTLGLDHDYSASTRLHTEVRYSRARRDFRLTEAQIPAGTAVTTPLDKITVSRAEFQGASNDRFLQAQADLHLDARMGAVKHALVAGVEAGREWSSPSYITHVGVPGTNLAAPDEAQPYSYVQRYDRLRAHTEADTLGVYLLDTVSLGPHWQVIGGLRWDRFSYNSTGFSPAGAVIATTTLARTDEAVSWRGALLYKPTADTTLYLSSGSSFNPSAEGIESLISSGRALTQSNLKLDPEKGVNIELGAKAKLFGGRALASVAVFQLRKTNVRVPDPTTPGFNILGGEQRVRGLEAEVVGQITPRLNLRANYTYLDSEVLKSTTGGPLVGAALVVTPRHSASAMADYALSAKTRVGLGVRYVGERLGQNTAAAFLRAPGYTVFDAEAEQQLSRALSLRLNVYNLGDKLYYDQLHPFHVVPGAGRSAMLSLTYSR